MPTSRFFTSLALAAALSVGCAGSSATDSQTPPQIAPSPTSAIPPISAEVIQREGQIVSVYDAASDHTKVGFLARVSGQPGPLYLYAYFAHPGHRPTTEVSDVYLAFVAISSGTLLADVHDVTFTADGTPRKYDRVAYGWNPGDGGTKVEQLLIGYTFTRADTLSLASSTDLRVKLDARSEFPLGPTHLQLLRDLAMHIPA